MKGRTIFLIIALIVLADQAIKIYVKTHFYIGESHAVAGNWFQLYFIENEGMAYGWKFGGDWGKIMLTLFRLAAVIFGVFYIKTLLEKKYPSGFIICVALVFAGALGNLIDSMFYGMIFDNSSTLTGNVAEIFPAKGYGAFLHGRVVDMFYFPLIRIESMPTWIPFFGGKDFTFFNYIFNLADASISVGIITILFCRKHFFKEIPANDNSQNVEAVSLVNN